MTTYTDNYKLPLYEGSDKPDLADQYAEAMRLLDAALVAAQAARTELQNSVNTLNTNLAATNANVATALNNSALAKTDAANAVSVAQAAANTANAAGAEVGALKTDVENNKTLVEEHVNYFADLEITDEESANDVNTKINNAFQGTMSNTQAITALNGDVNELSQRLDDDDTWESHSLTMVNPVAGANYNLFYAINKTKTVFKMYGTVYNASGVRASVPRAPIPGWPGRYGIPAVEDTGLRPAAARSITYTGIEFYPESSSEGFTTGKTSITSYVLGTDGKIYLFPTTNSGNANIAGAEYELFFQCPVFLSPADWPKDNEGGGTL